MNKYIKNPEMLNLSEYDDTWLNMNYDRLYKRNLLKGFDDMQAGLLATMSVLSYALEGAGLQPEMLVENGRSKVNIISAY